MCHFASYSPDGEVNTHETYTTLYIQVTNIYISLISVIYNAKISCIKNCHCCVFLKNHRVMVCSITVTTEYEVATAKLWNFTNLEFTIIWITVFCFLCITTLMIMLLQAARCIKGRVQRKNINQNFFNTISIILNM